MTDPNDKLRAMGFSRISTMSDNTVNQLTHSIMTDDVCDPHRVLRYHFNAARQAKSTKQSPWARVRVFVQPSKEILKLTNCNKKTSTKKESWRKMEWRKINHDIRIEAQRDIFAEVVQRVTNLSKDVNTDNLDDVSLNFKIEQICHVLREAKICTNHEQMQLRLWSSTDQLTNTITSMFETRRLNICKQLRVTTLKNRLSSNTNYPSLKFLGTNDFDVFALEEESDGRPLSAMCNFLFDKHNLEAVGIDRRVWRSFFLRIEMDYRCPTIVRYHNRLHAAAVLASTYWFMSKTIIFQNECDMSDWLAMITAAAVHDVAHSGHSNSFLIQTESDLAITYNDLTIMENYHLAHTFRLLKRPELNIMKKLPRDSQRRMRKEIINLVLATDMSKHNSKCERLSVEQGDRNTNKDFLLKCTLHAADLCSNSLQWDTCFKFSKRIIEEFHDEGDQLRKRNLEVLPLFDRTSPDSSLASSQLTFIRFVVRPFYELLAHWVPELNKAIMSQMNFNYEQWEIMSKDKKYYKEMLLKEGKITDIQSRSDSDIPIIRAPSPITQLDSPCNF